MNEYTSHESSISQLQQNVSQLKNKLTDVALSYEEQFLYSNTEVGIRHEKTKSHLKFFDNGNIQMFAGGSNSGMTINKKFQSFNVYGEAVNIASPIIRMATDPNKGLMWNGHTLNPLLYQYSDKKNPARWNKNRKTPFSGTAYLDDFKLLGTARWWCPGVPNLCGRIEEEGGTHSGHWVTRNIALTPFYWQRGDQEYERMLEEIGIPI